MSQYTRLGVIIVENNNTDLLYAKIKKEIHQENQEGIKNFMISEMVRFTHNGR